MVFEGISDLINSGLVFVVDFGFALGADVFFARKMNGSLFCICGRCKFGRTCACRFSMDHYFESGLGVNFGAHVRADFKIHMRLRLAL